MSTLELKGVKPFSNGSEADYWRSRNCDRCAHNTWTEARPDAKSCAMEEAIALGFISGTIPVTLARRYGATIRGEYCDLPADCPRFRDRDDNGDGPRTPPPFVDPTQLTFLAPDQWPTVVSAPEREAVLR